MVLTPTKAHDQFMPALQQISKSLTMYGHSPIELVFTDNPRGDKRELETNIPSLLTDVVAVPDSSALQNLKLPETVQTLVLSSAFQINTRLNSIMSAISQSEFYVALDMEWSVNREMGIQGRVAVISMTYGQEIFLIPVCLPYTKASGAQSHLFIAPIISREGYPSFAKWTIDILPLATYSESWG